jgi:hypothetical protein
VTGRRLTTHDINRKAWRARTVSGHPEKSRKTLGTPGLSGCLGRCCGTLWDPFRAAGVVHIIGPWAHETSVLSDLKFWIPPTGLRAEPDSLTDSGAGVTASPKPISTCSMVRALSSTASYAANARVLADHRALDRSWVERVAIVRLNLADHEARRMAVSMSSGPNPSRST